MTNIPKEAKGLELKNGVWRAQYCQYPQYPQGSKVTRSKVTKTNQGSNVPNTHFLFEEEKKIKYQLRVLAVETVVELRLSKYVEGSVSEESPRLDAERLIFYYQTQDALTGPSEGRSYEYPNGEATQLIREDIPYLVEAFKRGLPFTKESLFDPISQLSVYVALGPHKSTDWTLHEKALKEYRAAIGAMENFARVNILAIVNQKAEEIIPTLDKLVCYIGRK